MADAAVQVNANELRAQKPSLNRGFGGYDGAASPQQGALAAFLASPGGASGGARGAARPSG